MPSLDKRLEDRIVGHIIWWVDEQLAINNSLILSKISQQMQPTDKKRVRSIGPSDLNKLTFMDMIDYNFQNQWF